MPLASCLLKLPIGCARHVNIFKGIVGPSSVREIVRELRVLYRNLRRNYCSERLTRINYFDKMAFLKIDNVLISDNLDNCCAEILSKNGCHVKSETKLTKEELLKEIPNYDALIVRSATKVTSEVLNAGKRLKLVGRAGTGVDNIDIPSATQNGVIVMNTPSGNTMSAAEHTCILIVSMARHIPQATASMKEGKWDRKKFMGNELFGKTLGIIGLGRIGQEVATRMQAFGMKTVGYDPLVPAEKAAEFNVEWLELNQIWPLVDYITVHTPLIPQTKGLLNDKTFGMCKKGVRVVNCARGGIIDEEALLKALDSGVCAAAALDVFVTEPPSGTSSKLVQHPNVISCPHLGASTVEAQKRVAEDIANQMLSAIKGESLFGAINASSLGGALQPENKPWLDLGVKLAKIASKFSDKKVVKMNVTTLGASLEGTMSSISASLLMGLMPSMTESKVDANLISAEYFAKESGLKVENNHLDMCSDCDLESGIAVALVCADGTSTKFIGTVFQQRLPVLVQVDQLRFTSPVVLADQLHFFKTASNPSKVFSQIAEHSAAENLHIVALHSASDGTGGVGAVKLHRNVEKNSKILTVDGLFQVSL